MQLAWTWSDKRDRGSNRRASVVVIVIVVFETEI